MSGTAIPTTDNVDDGAESDNTVVIHKYLSDNEYEDDDEENQINDQKAETEETDDIKVSSNAVEMNNNSNHPQSQLQKYIANQESDGSHVTSVDTTFVNFCARVRIHNVFPRYRILNYSSKSFALKDPNIIAHELRQQKSISGHFILENNKQFVFACSESNKTTNVYQFALRANTDSIEDGNRLLNIFVEKTEKALLEFGDEDLKLFKWDVHFQSIIDEIRTM